MRVAAYSAPLSPRVAPFVEGLRRHGIEPEVRNRLAYTPTDLAIGWAYKCRRIIHCQRKAGYDYLTLEMGYFRDREAYTSCGFNGLNGRADFHNLDMPGDRWEKHGVEVKPWKTDGQYVLVMGQVHGDAALSMCPDYNQWVREACAKARAYGLPVRFRPHPKGARIKAGAQELQGTLQEALHGAAAVITFNSNSATDAVLAGVPVVTVDRGAMAWALATHEIGAPLTRPDRTQWLHNLAYTQWTRAELESGEAWEHLKQRYKEQA